LQQVVWNLVSNAIKFTPDGGKVEVRVEEGENRLARIAVSDTGKGIDRAFLDRVFDRFSREREARVCVEASGSASRSFTISSAARRIDPVSTAPVSKGSTFVIDLPLLDSSHSPSRPLRHGTRRWHHRSRLDGRASWSSTTRRHPGGGCRSAAPGRVRVLSAVSAAEALSVFDGQTPDAQMPDVLISDLAMPGGDGSSSSQGARAVLREGGSSGCWP
jgi:hypothetical protein